MKAYRKLQPWAAGPWPEVGLMDSHLEVCFWRGISGESALSSLIAMTMQSSEYSGGLCVWGGGGVRTPGCFYRASQGWKEAAWVHIQTYTPALGGERLSIVPRVSPAA